MIADRARGRPRPPCGRESQYRVASLNVPSVIWYMPTALDAGWYHSKRIPRQMPPPVGPRHWVPSAFDLRQRCQQLRGDDRRRMLTEQRSVLFPRLGGALVE